MLFACVLWNSCFLELFQTNVVFNDWDVITEEGFFRGYNSVVWTVVSLQAGGGLVSISLVFSIEIYQLRYIVMLSKFASCNHRWLQ